ncbi:MAG: aminoacyl-tRNA hydrolase [Ilumatobacteraceae bacterium]|jgi:peptidyl-tRNA hydrolase, PTH1 family|nr:aminoacyl-tRNA hydrolase [Ilumatobacteraceae bacterium]MDP4701962.1 aminoacyl-tRNA hydrolase [Ilumatobacteraceae bacterium]MDP5109375.1 aminoacyl-tRNA hydrolase [Ilumatobacteraceae bacterium]
MLWLVVGLGNPGKKYEQTRHNVGQSAIDELCRRWNVSLREGKDKARVGETTLRDAAGNDHKVVFAIPMTFMNESGQAVRLLMKRHNLKFDSDIAQLIIVHDELDLEPGIVRAKVGGGLAGHNGLRSITSHLSTQDYARVRIGVGKPPSADEGADHVLRKVAPADRVILDAAVGVAADVVESFILRGSAATMNTFNTATS